ncbi:MAG: glycine cleavage system aminomethyltransferase GcvT [Thermoplasmata archaeon]|nr:glycine cleavage system aminomethyltransferase GcvT [Thermoplasmata archaeon]
MKRTALYDRHIGLDARMTEFGGWEMPLWYSSLIEEHLAVRKAAGLFDVSHMGDLFVSGPDALELVHRVQTNHFQKADEGEMKYAHILDREGRIKDDTIVTVLGDGRYLIVPNAGTTPMVHKWFLDVGKDLDVRIEDRSEMFCLALQGPKAAAVYEDAVGERNAQTFFTMRRVEIAGSECMVERSGYTGEDGFEIIGSPEAAGAVWDLLMKAGKRHGLRPVGLGARDTLRLEKCFLLSGQDFHGDRTPLETTYDWVIKWDHDFIGREALLRQKEEGGYDIWTAFLCDGRGVPRHGDPIVAEGKRIGVVTSGTMSPVLRTGIAMGYVSPGIAEPGAAVDIEVRGKAVAARAVEKPFVK